MSDQLPRLGGLSEPEKYERLVERVPGVWWSDEGPFAGLHELNACGSSTSGACSAGSGGSASSTWVAAAVSWRRRSLPKGERDGYRSVGEVACGRPGARAPLGLSIDYRSGSAEDLGGAGLEGTFDLVFAVDVLEHVEDLERTIAGIARVLAPGGGFGFLTHNRTIAGFLQVVWDEEYVQHTMPRGSMSSPVSSPPPN